MTTGRLGATAGSLGAVGSARISLAARNGARSREAGIHEVASSAIAGTMVRASNLYRFRMDEILRILVCYTHVYVLV
jgi:hypothetical protein